MTDHLNNDVKPQQKAMAPRFHPAHPSAIQASNASSEVKSPSAELLSAVAGRGDVAGGQMQQQAAELAEHLRQHQHTLARREASLNARCAQYDDQQRMARLWLRERHEELDNREAEIQCELRKQQEQTVENQASRQSMESLARQQEQLEQIKQGLKEDRRQLSVELENVQHQAEWLEAARDSWRRQCLDEQRTLNQLREQLLDQRQATEELNHRLREQLAQNQREIQQAEGLTQQQRDLEIQAAQIREQHASIQEQRQTLRRDRELWQARTVEQRQAIASRWRRRHQELQRLRQLLQSRQESIDVQEESLRRQRDELERQQREIVQRQLVVRHAQATLNRQFPVGDFSHIEQAVRRYVESQLASAEQTLAARKKELHELAASLQQQQEILKIRHARLHAHIARRQHELDARTES